MMIHGTREADRDPSSSTWSGHSASTQERLRVAEALEEFPELERAVRDGELS
jgi:hypothetical protein